MEFSSRHSTGGTSSADPCSVQIPCRHTERSSWPGAAGRPPVASIGMPGDAHREGRGTSRHLRAPPAVHPLRPERRGFASPRKCADHLEIWRSRLLGLERAGPALFVSGHVERPGCFRQDPYLSGAGTEGCLGCPARSPRPGRGTASFWPRSPGCPEMLEPAVWDANLMLSLASVRIC